MTGAELEVLDQARGAIDHATARARAELALEHVLGELAASLHEVSLPSGGVTVCRLDAPQAQQLMRLAESALGLDRRAPCLAQPAAMDGPGRAASIAAQLYPTAQSGI